MNKRRMNAVLRRIVAEPGRWYQGSWHYRSPDAEACKTMHCIGGWAEALMHGDKKGKKEIYSDLNDTQSNAIEYLGLTDPQAVFLFFYVTEIRQIRRFIDSGGKLPPRYRFLELEYGS